MQNLNVHQEKVGFINDSTSAPGVLNSYSNQEDFPQIMGWCPVVCLFVFKQIQKCNLAFKEREKYIHVCFSTHSTGCSGGEGPGDQERGQEWDLRCCFPYLSSFVSHDYFSPKSRGLGVGRKTTILKDENGKWQLLQKGRGRLEEPATPFD